MFRKKLMPLFFVMLLILSGCAGFKTGDSKSADSGDKVVIDFWSFWGSEIRRPVIDKIVADFNESQDKIEVKHTFVPWGDIWTKELAAIAAKNPPDVVINDINATALRGQKNQAMNLSQFLEKDDISDRFYEELWNATLYEGDSYGIPFNTDTRILFYNKTAFKEAGLDPEKPPATWEELWEYAEKLDVKNGDTYDRIGFYPLWGVNSDVWMLNSDGKNFFDEDGAPIIDTEANRETLEWVLDWHEKYGANTINSYKSQIDSQQGNPFFNGKLAMYVNTPTFYTQIRDYAPDLDFGVAMLPEREPGSGNTSWGGGFVAEIPQGSKHPEEAWEFIKHLTDAEAQEYWAVKNFDNVANIEAAENAAKNSEMPDRDKVVYQMAIDNMENTLLTPVPVNAPDFMNLVNPELDSILLGKKSIEQGLKDAQQSLEKLIEKSK
ncbi:ABC transporter substrate-binding protein [Sporosarcina luteola]|uniref:ABC transporter substrate-binding protein n=1 Tax=Bacillales TaxID=1385 RepID=UPI00203F0B42|nr:ABC transporter substrate-binding protein [Saccharococcus sp. Marseille-Q5394]MCM3636110.1 ABC transporter substrate-binding protein [Sporosarcina luteola]